MREGIHPKYKSAKVVCACGNVIETRSTRGDFSIEICAACHPFFTGKQKIMDTAGRIERFKTRYAATPAKAEHSKTEKAKTEKAAAPAPRAEVKKASDNRAAKRAKANAGKPRANRPAAPAEASAPEGEAGPEAKA